MTHSQPPTEVPTRNPATPFWVAAVLLTIIGLLLLDPPALIHELAHEGGSSSAANSPTSAPPTRGRQPTPTPLTAHPAKSPHVSDSPIEPSPTPFVESDGSGPSSGRDDAVQRALEQSTPRHLSGVTARAAAAATWQQLKNDLWAGGWSELHREAVVVAPASRTTEPGEMTVTVLWSGTRAITGPTGRRQITAHVVPTGNHRWRIELLP